MFLNLHSNNKRLLHNFSSLKQQNQLSSNGKICKEKSFSCSSFKHQLSQFKNKSLSHANIGKPFLSYLKTQSQHPISPILSKKKISSLAYNGNESKTASNLNLDNFRKSYLNLDSKLNKSNKQKNYFKKNFQDTAQAYPSSYLHVKKIVRQESRPQSQVLMNEIKQLKEQNQILRRQNQHLRNQRAMDLQTIGSQKKIIQKLQKLTLQNREKVQIQSLHSIQRKQNNLSTGFRFSNNKNDEMKIIYQVQQNQRRKKQKDEDFQLLQFNFQKFGQEKKLMERQIYQLVYQCEKYKQQLRKAEEKYQKQSQLNKKLIQIISSHDKEKHFNLHKLHQVKNINQNIDLLKQHKVENNQNKKEEYLYNKTNSIQNSKSPSNSRSFSKLIDPIKRVKQDIYLNENQTDEVFDNSSTFRIVEKPQLDSKKSFSNKVESNYHVSSQKKVQQSNKGFYLTDHNKKQSLTRKQQMFKEIQATKKRQNQKQISFQNNKMEKNRQQKEYYHFLQQKKPTRNLQNTNWCHNHNIRKYLQEINKEKIKQMQQIDSLLKTDLLLK